MLKKGKPYRTVFKLQWSQAADYRVNFIFNFVCAFIPVVAITFLWIAIFREKDVIEGYTIQSMLTYVLLAKFLQQVIVPEFFWNVTSDIMDGQLTGYLMKPISYIKYIFFGALGEKSKNFVVTLIPILAIAVCFSNYLNFSSNVYHVMAFLATCILAYVLYFVIFMTFSLLSFWFLEISSVFYTLYIIIEFFSGSIIPIDLFPKTLQSILNVLPFKYLIFFPINVYIGKCSTSEILTGLAMQVMWIGIFYAVIKSLWLLGMKRYEAYGG